MRNNYHENYHQKLSQRLSRKLCEESSRKLFTEKYFVVRREEKNRKNIARKYFAVRQEKYCKNIAEMLREWQATVIKLYELLMTVSEELQKLNKNKNNYSHARVWGSVLLLLPCPFLGECATRTPVPVFRGVCYYYSCARVWGCALVLLPCPCLGECTVIASVPVSGEAQPELKSSELNS